MEQFKEATLTNLAEGAAEELFSNELAKVLANIDDPNTSATAKREITLKIVLTPHEDRRGAKVAMGATAKLAPTLAAFGTMFVANQNGEVRGFAHDPKQLPIPMEPEESGPKVASLKVAQ